jgi:hypothetical protein
MGWDAALVQNPISNLGENRKGRINVEETLEKNSIDIVIN